jgi:single-stranded-DNA-specific exonuclease
MNRDKSGRISYETQWRMYGKKADFFGIAEKYNIDPVIARVIRNRDVVGDEAIDRYLHGDMSYAHDPALMKDMEKGCSIMLDKIQHNNHIRIISDYDVDGVTSNYILYMGLKKVWAHIHGRHINECDIVDYDIPHRIYDGYGINSRMVDEAYNSGVDTIITCDNGIAAYEAVAHARELNMTIIVTDHHDIPYDVNEQGERVYKLPPAHAVIDHKQVDCKYPCKELCGAGVAYKFIQLLYRMSGINEQECEEFIEYLGIATVCDIMKLVDENRIFVRAALEKLPHSTNPGLRALIRNSGRENVRLSSFDLGFIIGPCINAAGRLDDATTSLEFLLEQDSFKAEERAIELLNINNERKAMTTKGTELALEMLESADEKTISNAKEYVEKYSIGDTGIATLADKVLVMYIPGIHESLVGIIAGRIKERYYRPVYLFTDSEEAGIIKGSGRSIEGYNMYDEINKCSSYFTRFGGHAMAAGFSMEKCHLAELREKLNANAVMDESIMTPKLYIDVPMPLDYINFRVTEQLALIEPFGKGNEKPVFAQSKVAVKRAVVMGKNKNVLKVTFVMNNGGTIDGLNFEPEVFISNIKEWFGETECDRMLRGLPNRVVLDVAYYPDINEYAGNRTLQIKILEYREGHYEGT